VPSAPVSPLGLRSSLRRARLTVVKAAASAVGGVIGTALLVVLLGILWSPVMKFVPKEVAVFLRDKFKVPIAIPNGKGIVVRPTSNGCAGPGAIFSLARREGTLTIDLAPPWVGDVWVCQEEYISGDTYVDVLFAFLSQNADCYAFAYDRRRKHVTIRPAPGARIALVDGRRLCRHRVH